MRTKLILSSLILAVSLTSQSLLGEAPAVGLSLRQQFDSEISNLQKNLKACKKADEQWIVLKKSEAEIKELRANNPLQIDPDEIYMDLVTSSLKSIPRKGGFKKPDCDAYRTTILAQFEPSPTGKPDDPILPTMNVLDILCRR